MRKGRFFLDACDIDVLSVFISLCNGQTRIVYVIEFQSNEDVDNISIVLRANANQRAY